MIGYRIYFTVMNFILTVVQWFTPSWWKYLLAPIDYDQSRITTFICRAKGHPYGVVFYDISGTEPDMTCKNCGDDLG